MGKLGRAAQILLIVSFGAFFAIHAFAAPMHLTAEDWPSHALNHHLRGSISGAALAAVGIVLVFTALKARWGWWTIALILLASAGGFWFAYGTFEFGSEFERPKAVAVAIVQTITGALGLALAWPISRRSS